MSASRARRRSYEMAPERSDKEREVKIKGMLNIVPERVWRHVVSRVGSPRKASTFQSFTEAQ